ncbi:type I restriction endonuclease subunit R [Algoriphagus hitonicola]|uniref:type I site-specific deoxyribonuclease n=1 Tax=Algoriphagus hitonicola TaxID=435880 RepID=A0A1I2P054_9BACT|nr:type I restriction endonuclease [Algoriphagus hitonicola]SFG07237.1 type I restriction enzyme, R subunit [Algoriphagus hitonicola]
MAFNEDSRVKIPAILHLIRLGFTYIPQNQQNRKEETNIFEEIFIQSIQRINPQLEEPEIKRILEEIILELDFEDLGRKFFERLTSNSGVRLIDFQNFSNNSFHITTELTCKNGDEEFRPDITILINGMPLAFIEVKKPHNREGIIAERKRINERFRKKHFRRFANITQLMVFSNNMEYEDGIVDPVFGTFYATSSYKELNFNYFREDPEYPVKQGLKTISEEQENAILKDNNLMVIKHSPEFITNKSEFTPTHRILTSLFSRERLSFILKYALAYVEDEIGLEKHIMRYPQLFATTAIAQKLSEGRTKGIIWHTQGSGKTALAYFNVKHLTDFYQKQQIVPKFYFVVDRLDLLIQASTEFSNRGLKVNQVNSRQEFVEDLKAVGAIHNDSGLPEITVVNIQKFSQDATVLATLDYDINIQRIFFLDEAHRSYNPKGNYLANLINSDRKAVKIALTGTPLLREVAGDYDSKTLFGNYIHKYYYNMSIADGYTLRLIREEIEGKFKMEMKELMDAIKIQHGEISKAKIYAHPKFAEPLLEYILEDLIQFRRDHQDASLGGMVVCDSSQQAKELFRLFETKYGKQETDAGVLLAAEPKEKYATHDTPRLKAALILHDENDKGIRKDLVKVYKKGNIDLLFVYNMLLTGFDAKRLKKLYLARVIQDHNLLQTLTRVNRPYKKYKYGYVVDFADISKAFNRTNKLYFDELQAQLGDEMELYSDLFKSPEEIQQEIQEIKEVLFQFDSENREIFSQQIAQVTDKGLLIRLVKALRMAKELKNLIAINGYEALDGEADFEVWNRLLIEAQNRLDNINYVESLGNEDETINIINTALEDIVFQFIKVSESELVLADEFKDMLRKTRESLRDNFDQQDPAFVSLREELERIFKKKNLSEVSQEDLAENMPLLRKIHEKAKELNRKNNNIKAKYGQDEKFARVHKRLMEESKLSQKQLQLQAALLKVKSQADESIQNSKDIMGNEEFFKRYMMQLVIKEFRNEQRMNIDFTTTQGINQLIVNEYISQYNSSSLR